MNADEMPRGQTITVAKTKAFRSTATRISNEMVEIVYYDQPTNDETLKFLARVDGASSERVYFDRVYWSVTVNGRPATESDLQDIGRKPKVGISVDGAARKLAVSVGA
jgi:hypothetical protein